MSNLIALARSMHREDFQELWFQYGLVSIIGCLTFLGLLVPYLEGWK